MTETAGQTLPFLEIRDLRIIFPTPAGVVHAVNGIDLELERGEVFGLVGETGCGKTVTGLAVLGLVPPPGRVSAKHFRIGGEDLLSITDWRRIRGRRVAMIFQDPAASLNPTFTIGSQLTQVIRHHAPVNDRTLSHALSEAEGGAQRSRRARRRALELLADVGLPDGERALRAYPHELSGGMQQRAMIALALASGAELLIADEPTTALDVTIQAQILRLLIALREKHSLTILLITHDLGVVAQTCDRVAVLYAGTIVETGRALDLFRSPKHPYTQGLLAALPRPGSRGRSLLPIEGSVPSGLQPIVGCPFAPRCPHVFDRCRVEQPALRELALGQFAACHLYEEQRRA